MGKRISEKFRKLFSRKSENVEEGFIARILNRIFAINKTEKQKILSLLAKTDVQDLLFYTDVRNVPSILKYGIKTINNIKLNENEIYYVWSYLQHDNSIDLEFDNSTRAYFWKWTNDITFNPKTIAVIGINPHHLNELTQKDWLLDRAQNFVNVSENIYAETFSWLLVQDIAYYKTAQSIIKSNGLEMDLYYGDNGVVKIATKEDLARVKHNKDDEQTQRNKKGEN